MKKFFLLDYYEGRTIVGTYQSRDEATAAKREYERECDYECSCEIIESVLD